MAKNRTIRATPGALFNHGHNIVIILAHVQNGDRMTNLQTYNIEYDRFPPKKFENLHKSSSDVLLSSYSVIHELIGR